MNRNEALARMRRIWARVVKTGELKSGVCVSMYGLDMRNNCPACQFHYESKYYGTRNAYCNRNCIIPWPGYDCMSPTSPFKLNNAAGVLALINKAIARYDASVA